MKIYLVGGAVRDQLLGLPVDEHDWVVVGATPTAMQKQGFVPIDSEFPVFRHPQTGDEYALARRETKRGEGYRGFAVYAGSDVTLEEDLRRRDLTINAMAKSEQGDIIDPFGGRDDLDHGLLRHVSPAFVEDPLRVLRVARFAAKLGAFGFRVAHATHRLMRTMVEKGDMAHLTAERLWREMAKAMSTAQPWRFFEVLQRCGALAALIPELARRLDEGDGTAHGAATGAPVAALKRVTDRCSDTAVRLASVLAVCVDTADQADVLSTRLRADRETAQLIRRTVATHESVAAARRGEAAALLELIQRWRGFDRDADLAPLIDVADAQFDEPRLRARMAVALRAASAVGPDDLRAQGFDGSALGVQLRAARRVAIEQALSAAGLQA